MTARIAEHPPPRMTPAQQRLAEAPEALDLVDRIARHYARRTPSLLDDYRSAGAIGLVQAAMTSDPNNGGRFLAYAGQAIRWAILKTMKKNRPLGFRVRGEAPRTLSLDAEIGEGLTLGNTLIDHRQPELFDPFSDMETCTMTANGTANGSSNGHYNRIEGMLPRRPAEQETPEPDAPILAGVHQDEHSGRWKAGIRVCGVLTTLGTFASEEKAQAAYSTALKSSYASRQAKRKASKGETQINIGQTEQECHSKPASPEAPARKTTEIQPTGHQPTVHRTSLDQIATRARLLAQTAELFSGVDPADAEWVLEQLRAAGM
jgi:hypothetical protein